MLKLESYTRFYGYKKILEIPFFELKKNEIVCILGPNGAGKTTFLEGILSHNRQGNTKIYYNNEMIEGMEKHYQFLRNISYLGHEIGLFLDLSLWENLQYFAELYSIQFKPEKMSKILKQWELFHRKDDEVRTFSRGMKQKSALIRTMLTEPQILLLDEPLTGLDSRGKTFLIQFLKDFKQNGSVILITHDDEIFFDIVDRFVFLFKGKLIADIPNQKFFEKKQEILNIIYSS